MKPSTRSRLFLILRLLTSLAMLGWLVWKFNWQEIWQSLQSVAWWVLGIFLAGSFLARFIAFYRFWQLVRFEGAAFSYGTMVRLGFFSSFLSNFLPSTVGGDVAKIGWITAKGYPVWKVTLWALIDRLTNTAAIILLLPASMFVPSVGQNLGAWLVGIQKNTLLLVAVITVIIVIIVALLFMWRSQRQKVADLWQALLRSSMARRGLYLSQTLVSLLSILPVLVVTWLAAVELGMRVGILEVTAVYVFLYFITLLPVSINGLGLQEVSMVVLYQGFGASLAQAGALAVIYRFGVWATTLPGAFFLGRGVADEKQGEPVK